MSEALTAGAGLIDRLQAATREPVPDMEGVIRAIGQQAALHPVGAGAGSSCAAGNAAAPGRDGVRADAGFDVRGAVPCRRTPGTTWEVMAGRLLDEGFAPVRSKQTFGSK